MNELPSHGNRVTGEPRTTSVVVSARIEHPCEGFPSAQEQLAYWESPEFLIGHRGRQPEPQNAGGNFQKLNQNIGGNYELPF